VSINTTAESTFSLLFCRQTSEWRTHQVRGNKKYEATIENLESGKEYEMMVLSQDSYNDGLFSKSFRYRTKGLNENA
jgi:hypothetical protein